MLCLITPMRKNGKFQYLVQSRLILLTFRSKFFSLSKYYLKTKELLNIFLINNRRR